jgi:hypothetical protein
MYKETEIRELGSVRARVGILALVDVPLKPVP